MGLVWRNRKKISQIINAYLYLLFFLFIILWFKHTLLWLLVLIPACYHTWVRGRRGGRWDKSQDVYSSSPSLNTSEKPFWLCLWWTLFTDGGAWLSMVARLLAVRQARVRFWARHHREVSPTELTSDEEMERGPGEWRRINVLYECNWMNVCYKNMKNKQKEWHPASATKPFYWFIDFPWTGIFRRFFLKIIKLAYLYPAGQWWRDDPSPRWVKAPFCP